MQEYEVDLRDYLRVIWEKKWIVVGVFVVAVAAAAVFSFSLPNEYEGNVLMQLEKAPFPNIQLQLASPQTIRDLLTSKIFQQELSHKKDLGLPADQLVKMLKVELLADSTYLFLTLKGALSPQKLGEFLAQYITVAQQFLRERINEELQKGLAAIEQRRAFVNQQKNLLLEELQRWISRREESLRQQKQALKEQLDALLSSKGRTQQESQFTESIFQQSYASLTGQLQSLDKELGRLGTEKESKFPRPGSGMDDQLTEIDRSLQQLNQTESEYQWLLGKDWTPISVITEPQGSPNPIGPRRVVNITIAGVFGLFAGVLLVFFVRYLEQPSIASAEGIKR